MNVLFSTCTDAIERAIDTKTFGCFYSTKNDPNKNIHLHECCEILFCLSGGKTFFIDERIYEVQDGDVFVLNQFEAHKITSIPECVFERYVLQIHPAFLYDSSSSETDLSRCFFLRGNNISHKLSLSCDESEKLSHIFRKLSQSSTYGEDILRNIAAIEILTVVNKYFSDKNKDFTYHSKYENNTIVNALKYINNNFSEELSLEIVAKNCFITVNELCRLFKKHMDSTVAKYILSRRITEAKKLLKNGESVSQTAEKCGFSDYTSFIRAFKRCVGIAPGQYKKSKNE